VTFIYILAPLWRDSPDKHDALSMKEVLMGVFVIRQELLCCGETPCGSPGVGVENKDWNYLTLSCSASLGLGSCREENLFASFVP